jgi:hypothetical protein
VPGHASFAVRTIGGDVSYFGGVLVDDGGMWTAARFAKCPDHKTLSCAYPGTTQPYGHLAHGAFVSVSNDCTPNCAAGTDYRITWRWKASERKFVVGAVRHQVRTTG